MANRMKATEQQRAIEQKWHKVLVNMPSQENVREAYEELHSFYLSSRGYLYGSSFGMGKKVILDVVGSGKAVLDLGCGDGALACALGKRRNVVLGLDISSRAIEEALKKSSEWNVSEWVRFRQGNAVSTGLDDAIFDIVVSYTLIEHLHPTQLGAHLDEVKRLLKRNGAYVLFVPNKHDGPSSFGMHLKEGCGFYEMRGLLEEHGFACYWLDTRINRLARPILVPPRLLWLPELMERTYVKLGCKHYLRPFLRPNVFFYAKKTNK